MRGGTQIIPVTSKPSGATFEIYNKYNYKIFVGTTPSYINMEKEALRYCTIHFKKDGYFDRKIPLGEEIEGWYWGNLLGLPFGGLPAIIGLIVDGSTGN